MGQLDSKEIERAVVILQSEKDIHHSQSQQFLHDFHTNSSRVVDVRKFEDDRLRLFLKYFIKNIYSPAKSQSQGEKNTPIESYLQKEHEVKLASLKIVLQKVLKLNSKLKQKFELVCQEITKIMIDDNYSEQKNSYISFIFELLEVENLSNFVFDSEAEKVDLTHFERNLSQAQVRYVQSTQESQKYPYLKQAFDELLQGKSHMKLEQTVLNRLEMNSFAQLVGNVYLVSMPINAKKSSYFLMDLCNYFGAYDCENGVKNQKMEDFIQDVSLIFNILFSGMKDKNASEQPPHICWIVLKMFSISQNFNYKNCIQEISKNHSSGFYEVDSTPSLSDLFDKIYSAKSYHQYSKDVEYVNEKIKVLQENKKGVQEKVGQFLNKLYKEKAVRYISSVVRTQDSDASKNSICGERKKFASFHNIQISAEKGKKQNVTINVIAPKNHRRNHQSLLSYGEISINRQTYDVQNIDFNILEVPVEKLEELAAQIFSQMDFVKNLPNKNYKKMDNFLKKLNKGYSQNKNSFHNFTHGVNVMHTSFLLCLPKKSQEFLSQLSRFSLVLSSLCHDVGHTGFNNAFQIATNSPLAQQFNDISPLENYHISRTLQLLKSDSTNFLDQLPVEQFKKLRKLIISNILYTDIKEHFNLLKKFEQKKTSLKSDEFQDEKLFSGMLIHSSDFGGSIKDFSICQEWSQRVNQEFMNQSAKQKQLELPLSPFMLNLDKPAVMAKNEFGFLKFMVQPLFKSISEYFQSDSNSIKMLETVNKNVQKWQQKLREEEEKNSIEIQNI